MMGLTFLENRPQPGDGAWLLQYNDSQRPRRSQYQGKFSFLDRAEVNGRQPSGHPERNLTSHLEPTGKEWTSSTMETGRLNGVGVDNSPFLIEHGRVSLLSPPLRIQSQFTPLSHDSAQPEYRYAHRPPPAGDLLDNSTPYQSDDMAAATKLPPHLRSKKASTPSSTDQANQAPSGGSFPNIIEKLAEHGVKVGKPGSVTALGDQHADSGNTKVTARESSQLSTKLPSSNGRDQPPSTADNVQRHQGNARRGRGRGDGFGSRGANRPKSRDFPKGEPRAGKQTSSSSKSGFDSLVADGSFGDGKKKRGSAKNPDDYKLSDYNGAWAPAPLDWDGRPAFRESQSAAQIESWMDRIEKEMKGIDFGVSHVDITLPDGAVLFFAPDRAIRDQEIVGETAPEYWQPVLVGKQTRELFWHEFVTSDTPSPVDEHDLQGVQPWWKLYHVGGCPFLQPLEHPKISRVDPDENTNERLARENDNGSAQHLQNRINFEKAKHAAELVRRQRADARLRRFVETPLQPLHNRIKPGINLYVRSAKPNDINQIRDVYNHYVDFAWCTPEMERRTSQDMQQRLRDIQLNKLPFLVACERGGKVPARSSRKKRNEGEDLILPDRVVGFALADDYNDMLGMYRFTAEVEVYVHNACYMKGVAKCLLDKLMGLLDPEYVERGGFDICGEDLDGTGPSRVIQNIIINLPYEKPERLEWMSRWLTSWLHFEKVGDLKGVGNKNSKSVSLAIFQRKTGATFKADSPPIMGTYPK